MPRLRPAPEPKKEEVKVEAQVEEQPQIEVVEPPPPEPKVEVVEPPTQPEQDESALALQKQLEELKKSEELQRQAVAQAQRDRDEALKRAQESNAEIRKFRKEAEQSQYDAISTALGAAQSEAESAKRDIKTAIANGDADAQADAYERLATARANISKLEDGKYEIEARQKAAKEQPEQQLQQQQVHIVDTWNLPAITTQWLKARPEYINSPKNMNKLRYLNDEATDLGYVQHTQEFLDYLDERMKQVPTKQQQTQQVQQQQSQPQQRTPLVSAPVSREVPSGSGSRQSGKIKLTPQQAEYARIAGVSVEEYAKQLLKINEMKANGQLSEQR